MKTNTYKPTRDKIFQLRYQCNEYDCPYDSKDTIAKCSNCSLVAESKRLFGHDLVTI